MQHSPRLQEDRKDQNKKSVLQRIQTDPDRLIYEKKPT